MKFYVEQKDISEMSREEVEATAVQVMEQIHGLADYFSDLTAGYQYESQWNSLDLIRRESKELSRWVESLNPESLF